MNKTVMVAGLLLAATTSWAGWKNTASVWVSGNMAGGMLGTARNSADTRQHIGCSITTYTSTSSNTYTYATCDAADAGTAYGSCITYNPDLIATIRSLDPDGRLFFLWDSAGTCQYINVQADSALEPRKP